MSNLSFGGFVWPNDPEKYQEKCVREPVYARDEDGNNVFAGMSPLKRTITGSGVFFGSDAYARFRALLLLVDMGEPMELWHPNWGTRKAFLTELVSDLDPRENCVAYNFTFLVADTENAV